MALPVRPLPIRTIYLDGEAVEIRSLSRSEAMHFLTGFADEAIQVEKRIEAAEVFILSRGCSITEEEAQAFRDGSTAEAATQVIDAIIDLSGLNPENQPSPKADGKESSTKDN